MGEHSRQIRWPSTGSDAGPVQPGCHVAARPHAAPGMLSLSLDLVVHAMGIIRPIERQTISYQPLAEVSAVHSAGCDSWSSEMGVQLTGPRAMKASRSFAFFRAASILQTIFAPAELCAFGRIDTPQPNACAMNFYCVAIDHTGLAGEV